MSDARRQAWEDRTAWPLITAAVVFLAAYAWPILDPSLPRRYVVACEVALGVVWVVFVVDYVVRLALAHSRVTFVRTHLLDLASVALPLLRPLQLLRLVSAIKVLDRKLGDTLRGKVGYYVVAITVLVATVVSLAMLDAERGAPEATIESFPDAVWWSFTTMTTVGYGDEYPVTALGRVIAVALMLFGVALLGIVTASMASYLVERVSDEDEADRTATARDLAQMTRQTEELTAEVARLRRQLEERGAGA